MPYYLFQSCNVVFLIKNPRFFFVFLNMIFLTANIFSLNQMMALVLLSSIYYIVYNKELLLFNWPDQ